MDLSNDPWNSAPKIISLRFDLEDRDPMTDLGSP